MMGTTVKDGSDRAMRVLLAAIVSLALLVATGPVQAHASSTDGAGHGIEVMTYNMYLGANLLPLFGITDPVELMKQVAAIYAHVQKVDFNVRAIAIARQIREKSPDVVSLQEVALWQTAPTSDPTDLTTKYNFLKILLRNLDRQGAPYRAVSVNPNLSGALPMSPTTLLKFTDRNVIIVRADLPGSGLTTTNPDQGLYAAALPAPILGSTFYVKRGWASVDVSIAGEPAFRFFDTHFEAFSPLVRTAQVSELAQIMSASSLPAVLAGDLNVYPQNVRDVDAPAWALLSGAGMVDSWIESDGFEPAWTAGQLDDLDNVPSNLDNTVDFVLHNADGRIDAVTHSGDIVGEELDDRTETDPPLWPSDHAGVVITLHIAAT
jgi:endonuclease/exonuclease/phosphatase family metal-dependent hydrolase